MPFNSPFTSVTIPDVGLASYVLDDLSPRMRVDALWSTTTAGTYSPTGS